MRETSRYVSGVLQFTIGKDHVSSGLSVRISSRRFGRGKCDQVASRAINNC